MMKRLVYKDLSGNNPRKREVSMEEVNDRIKDIVSRKWGSKYFVREKFSSYRLEDLKAWVRLRKSNRSTKNFHILRTINTQTGENSIICKIIGTFYLIRKRSAYEIVYVNVVKIKMDHQKNIKSTF